MSKAIFLDRDGILNRDTHYLHSFEDVEWLSGLHSSLLFFQRQGFLLFVISNQSGIGRGYFSSLEVDSLHQKMNECLYRKGISIAEWKYCPHSPQERCSCRKPQNLLVEKLIEKYELNRSESYFFGDKKSDLECASRSKIQFFGLGQSMQYLDWNDWWQRIGLKGL